MPIRQRLEQLWERSNRLLRALGWGMAGLSTLAFALSILWLSLEASWDAPATMSPADAFRNGSLGLEIAPYKLVAVLDILAPDALLRDPASRARGQPWWQHYGFFAGAKVGRCAVPTGFNVTHLLPISGTPVPTQFVGLTCAACHSQHVHNKALGVDAVVLGAGSSSADVIAFSDALEQAVAKPALTPALILDTYDKTCGASKSFWYSVLGRPIDSFFIGQWLAGFRATTLGNAAKYDMPFHGAQLLDAADIEAGPSRTRPFRSVIRNTLGLPAAHNSAFSKVPAAFEQTRTLRPQSQFDGSIANPVTRSLIAAFTSGSHQAALARAPMAHNIRAAAAYTETLGPVTGIKTFAEMFAGLPPADPAAVERGRDAYMQHCVACHGHRPSPNATWDVTTGASSINRISDLSAIGTDPERVKFRYSELLPTTLWITFPASPVPLAADTQVPACGGNGVTTLAAGTNLLEEQRAAIDRESAKAVAAGDFVLAQYWVQRKAQFDRDRRAFPAGHPLAFTSNEICSDPAHIGYINNPIPLAYLRAPYLHNASVPTMRQLLNLDGRPVRFCRGDDDYDPLAMGLIVTLPAADASCPTPLVLFDSTKPGNANTGHDFPWRREEVAANPAYRATLEDLLLYLRTQ